jgi:hypothetical protein
VKYLPDTKTQFSVRKEEVKYLPDTKTQFRPGVKELFGLCWASADLVCIICCGSEFGVVRW